MFRTLPLLLAALLAVPALAAPLAGAAPTHTATHVVVPSFDGTTLAATVFVPAGATAENPVPFVLMTHGWAGSRTATISGRVADLLNSGYGVLTWDSRGFGQSGGNVELNSPDYEVKDVSALLDWLQANVPALARVNGDPVIGMSGGSYAGGIQLLSAAFDPRIDVIAPEITWNDLLRSLAPNGVPKLYWTTLLFSAGQATSCAVGLDPRENGIEPGCQTHKLAQWYGTAVATNKLSEETEQALLYRSPATYMDRIQVPTLLVQGFPDTLFDVTEAVANYEGIKANGQPVKLWLYDGGHAGPNTQGGKISRVVLNWFDCHLALQSDCSRVGPEVEYFGTDGQWRTASAWPVTQDEKTLRVNGIPPLMMVPGAAPSNGKWQFVLEPATTARTATGSATVSFKLSTTSTEAFVFASLGVRRADGTVVAVADQTTPVRVSPGLGRSADVTMELVDVTATVQPGQALVLTLATSDPYFSGPRAPGTVALENIEIAWTSA